MGREFCSELWATGQGRERDTESLKMKIIISRAFRALMSHSRWWNEVFKQLDHVFSWLYGKCDLRYFAVSFLSWAENVFRQRATLNWSSDLQWWLMNRFGGSPNKSQDIITSRGTLRVLLEVALVQLTTYNWDKLTFT